MSCPDLTGLFFGEISESEKKQVEEHLKSCEACQFESERLRITGAALRSVPDEELPVHIRFVSDKVFEPKWWQRFRLTQGRALALHAMFAVPTLAAALLVWSSARTMAPVHATSGTALVSASATSTLTEDQVQRLVDQRVHAAVAVALHDADTQNAEKLRQWTVAFRREANSNSEKLVRSMESALQYEDRKVSRLYYAAADRVPVTAPASMQ